jgi:hypothetical protein
MTIIVPVDHIAAKIVNGVPQVSLAIAIKGKIFIEPQNNIVLPELVYGSYKDINGLKQYFSLDIPANTNAYSIIEANLCNYISVGTLSFVVYQGTIEGETLAKEVTDVDYKGLNGLANYNILIREVPTYEVNVDYRVRRNIRIDDPKPIIVINRGHDRYIFDPYYEDH